MDILGGINQPVSFVPKNTGNNINTIVSGDNQLVNTNVFSPELNEQISKHSNKKQIKRKNKNKRLNTLDSEYLPDEASENSNNVQISDDNNIFVGSKQVSYIQNFKKAWEYFFENTPLINYFFLKQKQAHIKQAVEHLNDINQNVDEMINTSVPFGEEKSVYSDIARSLTEAASIIGKVSKDI